MDNSVSHRVVRDCAVATCEQYRVPKSLLEECPGKELGMGLSGKQKLPESNKDAGLMVPVELINASQVHVQTQSSSVAQLGALVFAEPGKSHPSFGRRYRPRSLPRLNERISAS